MKHFQSLLQSLHSYEFPLMINITLKCMFNIVFKHAVAFISYISAPSANYYWSPFFLTKCFGSIRLSSSVFYLAKIVALCTMSKFHISCERDIS
jgi:hypothetical protein